MLENGSSFSVTADISLSFNLKLYIAARVTKAVAEERGMPSWRISCMAASLVISSIKNCVSLGDYLLFMLVAN